MPNCPLSPFKTILYLNEEDSIVISAGSQERLDCITQWIAHSLNAGVAFRNVAVKEVPTETLERLKADWSRFVESSSTPSAAPTAARSKPTTTSSGKKRTVGGTSRKPPKGRK
jgi:hypothetical protein